AALRATRAPCHPGPLFPSIGSPRGHRGPGSARGARRSDAPQAGSEAGRPHKRARDLSGEIRLGDAAGRDTRGNARESKVVAGERQARRPARGLSGAPSFPYCNQRLVSRFRGSRIATSPVAGFKSALESWGWLVFDAFPKLASGRLHLEI